MAVTLQAAAIALLVSCEDGQAVIRADADRLRHFDEWPEMEALALALDAEAPGWRAKALTEVPAIEDLPHG